MVNQAQIQRNPQLKYKNYVSYLVQVAFKKVAKRIIINLIIRSSRNAALGCIECLKIIKQEQQIYQTTNKLLQDDRQSCVIKDQQLQSKIKPYELFRQLIKFNKYLNEIHDFNNLPNVKVINSQLNKQDIKLEVFKYVEVNGDYIDIYNNIDLFGGYATIRFEINQWQVLKQTKLDYVYVALNEVHSIQKIQSKIKLKLLELCYMAQLKENQQSVLKSQKELLVNFFQFPLKILKNLNVNQQKRMKLQNSFQPQFMLASFILLGSNVTVNDLSKLISKYQL
ncbi:unnamed protein product [Paramecium sonneborni]|uniref:Uncharacterized protein n=1 Tax=Paramecium sonneborni TaxID=65129 RepID=A0A8S1PFU1_9CILI|nr:unnamed protein product [Paramecium sonneborni]